MRGKSIFISRVVLGTSIAALVFAAASPVGAQSADTWSLPEPSATPGTPRAQGPVDGQNPVVRPSAEATQPVPVAPPRPVPSAVPTLRPAAPPAATASPATRPSSPPRATPTPLPSAAPTTSTEATSPEPSATPALPITEPELPDVTSGPAPAEVAPAPSVGEAQGSWPAWWWAALAALLAAVVAAILIVRRRSGANDPDDSEVEEAVPAPVARTPAPVLSPKVTSLPVSPAPAAQPAPPADPSADTAPVTLVFEPVSLRLSLVYATLQYRLTITAGEALPARHLVGDMIGAHASIPPEQQLAPALDALLPLKSVPPMPAGETVTLKGELQLPLSAIRALQQGSASFFVPLVRLCLTDENGNTVLRRVFTVGLDGGTTALAPLRLDTGPQEHRSLAAREIEAARDYPLQPDQPRAAG